MLRCALIPGKGRIRPGEERSLISVKAATTAQVVFCGLRTSKLRKRLQVAVAAVISAHVDDVAGVVIPLKHTRHINLLISFTAVLFMMKISLSKSMAHLFMSPAGLNGLRSFYIKTISTIVKPT